MLPKNSRADKKDIVEIFKKGLFLTSPNLTFKYLKVEKARPTMLGLAFSPRISFIVPKTVSKSAVKRNFLRRCGYLALEKGLHLLQISLIGAFIFKNQKTENLENEIKNIFSKIH